MAFTIPQAKTHDYSDRWVITDDVVTRFIWLQVHSFMINYHLHDTIRQFPHERNKQLSEWIETPEGQWVNANASEDIKVEHIESVSLDTLVHIKVMARFTEQKAMLYTLKWK